MASKPVFSAEFTTTPQTATFNVVRNGAAPTACSVVIPADRYWLGESSDARNILTPLIAALNALSFTVSMYSISILYVVSQRLEGGSRSTHMGHCSTR